MILRRPCLALCGVLCATVLGALLTEATGIRRHTDAGSAMAGEAGMCAAPTARPPLLEEAALATFFYSLPAWYSAPASVSTEAAPTSAEAPSTSTEALSTNAEVPSTRAEAPPTSTEAPSTSAEEPSSATETTEPSPSAARRDPTALKERFNYASADCAAVVLRANREARGLTSILNSKKDQYMLNECAVEDKFVVVELCDDILVDTIVLGNYEFFSSTFKDVMVYVSDRYPPKNNQWTFVGHFQGFNSRDAQVFPVADPRTWARYVKFEFLSHYGQEFYCPLTVLKVYGATQMEQYRLEEEEDEDEELLDSGGLVIDTPLLGYHGFGLPYGPKRQHAKHQQPLQIDGSVSPASSYLKDLQGFASECQMCEAGEPQSTSRVMPKVPNLPWDQEVTCEATDQEYDEDNDDDDDVYDNDDNDDDEAEVAPKRAESREGREGAQDPLGRAGGTATATAPQRKQESIFKTIMRRLARVERNVTLAYHYLEEQHLVFNLVLQQVELNNLETMQLAIDRLNRTTSSQIKSLSMLSEEVWRAILYDLEEYHQHTQTDMADMGSRLEFLASEVLFEKRMNVAQLVLLLTIVVMIALSKAATKLALIPESKKEK